MSGHGFRDAAEQQAIEAAPAVRTENNQIRLPGGRSVQNGDPGIAYRRDGTFEGQLSGLSQDAPGLFNSSVCPSHGFGAKLLE